jgi:hypothetical protein
MGMTLTVSQQVTAGGKSFTERRTLTGDALNSREVSVPAAKTGTLGTRTNDTTGTLTMVSGHGITTGARLDIYWTTAGVYYARRGVVVGTVSGTSVPISGGSGDALPLATAALTAAVPQEEEFTLNGDDAVALVCYTAARGTFVFAESDNTEVWSRVLLAGGVGNWLTNGPEANPVEGASVAKVFLSHADSTGAKTMRLAALYNS